MQISKKSKFLFIQLPVISHDLQYNLDHCPYASYVLVAYLKKYATNIDVVRLPYHIETFGSDSLIVENILKIQPDIVCFSVYLWNVERSLYIAKMIKQRLPYIFIIFGGPEISVDNDFIIQNCDFFDYGIVGPGENTLLNIANILSEGSDKNVLDKLDDIKISDKQSCIFLKGIDVDLSKTSSPYLNKIGRPSYNNSILIETMRGCSYLCAYCYYHKNFKTLSYRDLDDVACELKWAAISQVKDISIVDPSFLKRRDIITFLRKIFEIANKSDYHIFCELNAEDVTLEIAELLKRCRVKGAEIGLQSINRDTLKLINRKWNKEKFIKGIKLLRNRDIEVLLDFIVGLPGDKIEDVVAGCKFALENDLFDDLGVYPLSVLPGTELRERKKDYKIDHLDEPPYLVVKTEQMCFEDIKNCFLYIEQETDIDFFPREFPLILGDYNGGDELMVYEIELGDRGITFDDFKNSLDIPFCCVILFNFADKRWFENFDYFITLYKEILDNNPYTLIDIIIDEEILKSYSFSKILDNLKTIITKRAYYIDRIYCDTVDTIRSSQIFLLLRSFAQEKCMVSIPLEYVHKQKKDPIFWFKIYGNEDISLEEYFLDKFSYLTKIENFSYRISYSNICNNVKIPLKKISFK